MATSNRPEPTRAHAAVRRRTVRRLVIAAVVLALGGVVAWAMIPDPTSVDVVTVRRGDVRVTVDEDGVTRVKDRYVVSAPLAGSLARIELHAGDTLAEGQVIARLFPSASPLLDARGRVEVEARAASTAAAVRQAESAVARARTASELAASELTRSRALVTQGGMAARDLERVEAEARARTEELASAEFGVRIARHEQTMARAATGLVPAGADADAPFEVRSPIAGRVLRVLHPGDGPIGPGTPLLEIGDPTALEVVVDVLTSDAVRIRAGQHAVVDRWGGEAPLDARVRLVEPSASTKLSALGVEEQRVNVVLELLTPPAVWSALGDGFRAEVSIVLDEARSVIAVPELCLARGSDGDALFEVRGGRVVRRLVEVGRRNGLEAEIRRGVAEGTRVVVHPSERLRDGERVVAR